MDILTIKEASALWGISIRRISVLCNKGRISGAQKITGVWLLPKFLHPLNISLKESFSNFTFVRSTTLGVRSPLNPKVFRFILPENVPPAISKYSENVIK